MKTANSRTKISDEATNLAIKLAGNQCEKSPCRAGSKPVRGKSICFLTEKFPGSFLRAGTLTPSFLRG